jgi:hypothetical protein
MSEREIGLAWMRAQVPDPQVPKGLPESFPLSPGCIVVHLLVGGSALLSGALPVEQIDAAIADWRTTGLSRIATRDAIFGAIATNLHLETPYGQALLIMAAGLAFTSGVAEALRERAEAGDLRITYTIEHYNAEASGKPMINFRLVASSPEEPQQIVPLSERPLPSAPTPDPLARDLVEQDARHLGRQLQQIGIPLDAAVFSFSDVDKLSLDKGTMVQLIIGTRVDLSVECALEAAATWKRIRAQSPASSVYVALLGYDQDPRALFELPEVCRHFRRWARAAGIPRDVNKAQADIGDPMQFPALMGLLAGVGYFGKAVRQQVLSDYRAKHGQTTRH